MSRDRPRSSLKRSSKPAARQPARPWRIVALLALIAVIIFAWWWARSAVPGVPGLAEYGEMDPDVRAFIARHLDEVTEAPERADTWTRLGLASEANGFVGLAARAYSRATELDPQGARSWYRLALVRARLGNQAGAFAALDRAVALDGSHAPAHWRRGLWLLDAGDLAGAQTAFERATAIAPDDPGGLLGLARVSLARGENEAAVAALEKLLDRLPGDRYALQLLGTAYRRLGRIDDAQFALAVGVRGGPSWRDSWSDDVGSYRRGFAATLKEATSYAFDGRFDQAIPLLERLCSEHPDDIALGAHLGGVYVAARRVEDGIRTLDEVLRRDPANFDAHLNLATAHLLARRLDLAARYAGRALELRPAAANALETQGMILWQSRKPDEALAVLRSALEQDPRRARPRVWIGMIHLERDDAPRALGHFEAALRSDPMLVDALAGIAMAQARLGAIEDGELALRRGTQIDPTNPRLEQARAYVTQMTRQGRR